MPMWCTCTVSAAGHFVPGALHASISYVPLYGASPLWFRAIVCSANVGAWATGHLQLEKYGVPLSVLRPAHDAFVTTVFMGLFCHFAAWYTFASIPYATAFALSFVGGCLTPSLSLLKYASGDLDTSYDGNTKLTHNSRNWWAHAVADLAVDRRPGPLVIECNAVFRAHRRCLAHAIEKACDSRGVPQPHHVAAAERSPRGP